MASAVAATVAATGIVVGPSAGAAHASTIGGTISRTEIISRAQYWVDHQPGAYSQTAYSPGPGGDLNYRRDCSGYVSMAWHLSTSTNTEGIQDSYTTKISRSDLQAGDVLDSYYNHVFLFDKWINKSAGTFYYYTFGSTPVQHLSTNINNQYLDGHPNSEYVALRYKKVSGTTTTTTTTATPASSTKYATHDKTRKTWLPQVVGTSDYAGIYGDPVDGFAINASEYRVHTLNGSWLPAVSKYNTADLNNGMAGILGTSIDGVAIKGKTYRVHTAKSGWLPWVSQYNVNDWNNGTAGVKGQAIDAIQVK